MKILQIPIYVSIPEDVDFSKLITGYGLMTMDIANAITQKDDVIDLTTINCFTRGKKFKKICILKRTKLDILRNIKIHDLYEGFHNAVKDSVSFPSFMKILFYFASTGYTRKIINSNHYDIIHFHGIGYANLPLIQYCLKRKQKFLVTLHGLNSISDSIINTSPKKKQMERDFLVKAENINIPVSVISGGIKKQILDLLKINCTQNFHIITNGCRVEERENKKQFDLYKKYDIGQSKKIMLCVGNLCERKNQIQVINAYSKLSKYYQENLSVLFLGNDTTGGQIKNRIEKLGLAKELILCGSIPKTEIGNFYRQADYTVLASKSEGFGLSIIEGYQFGLPNLTFKDLDAVLDVYDDKTMITIEERTDEALAEGMKKIMEMEWDKKYITKIAQRFSLMEMGTKYIDLYNKIINE